MKKLILSLVAIATIALSSFSQAPEGFKYQAVIRDASNLILNNQTVGLRMTLQQGAIGGTAVYTETFSTTSNAFGLVNLEIGNGTSTDDFTTIDWANGPYFMETAIDISGGTSYIVMGTSQLMSVPYALYAKTSGNGQGPVGPAGADGATGPQGSQGIAGNDGVDGADGATGPQGIAGNDGLDGIDSPVYSVGDVAQGGIVFMVDESGHHGLVCALNELAQNRWSAGIPCLTMATGVGAYSGEMNTILIIASQNIGDGNGYSALSCAELVSNMGGFEYGDWYLPSIQELTILHNNGSVVEAALIGAGGFPFNLQPWWSSTEINTSNAWAKNPAFAPISAVKETNNYTVRPIRRF